MAHTIHIVMYHAVVRSPLAVPDWCFLDHQSFRAQIEFFRSHCDVIPLSSVVDRLRAQDVDRPTVAMTFDDGFLNNYEVAYPVVREAGLPVTIFLTTGFVGTDRTLWYCLLNRALAATTRKVFQWGEVRFDLSTVAAKVAAAAALNAHLKMLPQPRLLADVQQIVARLGQDPEAPIEPSSPYRMLARAEIETMGRSGLVEFGAHTVSHAILSRISSNEQRHEIEQSVQAVSELTGRRCTLFAYPNGQRIDYDAAHLRMLVESGIQTAVTAIEERNTPSTSALELRRWGIGEPSDWEAFLVRLSDTSEPR